MESVCPSDPETTQPEMSLRTAGNWELKEIVDSRGSACPVTLDLSLVLGSEHRLHPCREVCVWTHTESPSLCLSHGNTRLCPRWSQNSEEGKTGSYIPSIPPSSMEPGKSSLITNTGDGMPTSSAFLCQPPPFSRDCHFTVIPGKCSFITESVANS